MPGLVRPFAGLRPAPERAADVAAPPYDVITRDEASALAEGRPWSFLHVSRPEIDLAPDIDPYAAQVYEKGAENFQRMIAEGVLIRDPAPCYYVYRLAVDGHRQTGVACVASVECYERNLVRKHEHTRPDKEDDRVRQITALGAQTGPVMATYRASAAIAEAVARAVAQNPVHDLTAHDGVRHTLWLVDGDEAVAGMTRAFDGLSELYIADGHHRSASAARVAAARRGAEPGATGEEGFNYFLTVAFPDDEVRILDYNRVVRDLNGLDEDAFLAKIGERCRLTPSESAVRPPARGHFGMYLPGAWYGLEMAPPAAADDPVAALDISLLHDNLIAPVLGVTEPRTDNRIGFVGGSRGLDGLAQRVDSGDMAVAFSLYPTSLADLMAVADAGLVMPAKSTWFEPKLADGLVSHLLD